MTQKGIAGEGTCTGRPDIGGGQPGLTWLQTILACWFIVLSPFQDTALKNTPLKLFAASPSVFPLALLLVVALASWMIRSLPRVNRTGFLIALYVAFVSALNLLVAQGGLPWKSLTFYGVESILLLFAAFGIDYDASRALRLAFYIAFTITVLGALTDAGVTLGSSILHATPSVTNRPRGFSNESSSLSVQVVAIGMLTAHFVARRWMKWSAAITTCVLLIYSDSKGGLLSLILCATILLFVKSRGSWRKKLAALVFLLPFVYFVSLLAIARFSDILHEHTTNTVATRLSMSVFALLLVAHNPFGVGFVGFLPSIPKYLPDAMRLVQKAIPVPLFFNEVRTYLYPPQTDADCKTFFFDYLVFFGLPFAIIFIRFVWKLLRQLLEYQYEWLFIGTLFCIIALSTYYSSLNTYAVPLLFGVAVSEVKRRRSSLRSEP